jgi:hypothetical protein
MTVMIERERLEAEYGIYGYISGRDYAYKEEI